MRKLIILGIVMGFMGVSLAAPKSPSRLDVTVQPAGAQVSVDGTVRGTAPLSIFDLAPGAHHIRIEAPAYVTLDTFVTMTKDDNFKQQNFALEREKGLLLLTTDPPGATVQKGGLTLGTTPLLATSLPAGETYDLSVVLNGYRPARVSVALENRTPVVHTEKLILDSGTLVCSTEPAGATILINGIERGVTPATVDRVPKGNASVIFRLAGYRDEARDIYLTPGDKQNLHRVLTPKPARLTIVTEPEGASVFVDDNYQGKSPTFVDPLSPGTHKVTVKMPGHEPVDRMVEIAKGAEKTETFKMSSVQGRIEVFTAPPGAKISLDGKTVGSSRGAMGATRSEAFAIEKVEAGKHQLLVHLAGHADVSRQVLVTAKETAVVHVRLKSMFIPDTEIETIHRTYRGVLISSTDESVTLEVSPGVEQVFPKADIRSLKPIEKK